MVSHSYAVQPAAGNVHGTIIYIPGPKYPKRSLDVFLQPFIQDLKDLWSEGVRTYDSSMKKKSYGASSSIVDDK